MIVERQCPFCQDVKFKVEKWGDIYLLKCLSPNTSAGYWVQMNKDGKFTPIDVYYPKPRVNMSAYDQNQFNKLQTPFWRMMGQKAKPHEIAYEKELKRRGMTYGDAVMARSIEGGNESALPQWEQALNSKEQYEPKYKKN